MKYAKEIIEEIESRGTIDTDDYLIDDGWEDYIREKGSMPREKRKPCINYSDGCEEWAGCPCVYYKEKSKT